MDISRMVELPLRFIEAGTEGTSPCPKWSVAEMVLESSILGSVNITLAEQGFLIDLCGSDSAPHLRSHIQPGFQEAPNIQSPRLELTFQ